MGVRKDQRILDVGCGAGVLLDRFARVGFRDLSGVDPFIERDTLTKQGVPVHKKVLDAVQDQYDVIMFNHSFEHLPSPRRTLQVAFHKLKPEGICVIRIPTPSSRARERYGVNWAQWDAPRHLTLISRAGMNMLAEDCGFRVQRTIDDLKGWSWAASELYGRGFSLENLRYERHFSKAQMRTFECEAAAANAAHCGDQAAFILAKAWPNLRKIDGLTLANQCLR